MLDLRYDNIKGMFSQNVNHGQITLAGKIPKTVLSVEACQDNKSVQWRCSCASWLVIFHYYVKICKLCDENYFAKKLVSMGSLYTSSSTILRARSLESRD